MSNKKNTRWIKPSGISVDGIVVSQKSTQKRKNPRSKNLGIIFLSSTLIIIGLSIIIFSNFFTLLSIFRSGKHLVIFQNSAELRPAGGFIGSFAEVDTNNFRITKLYFDSNIYKRDNDFTRENTVMPKDEILAEFIPEDGLAMRDSNWSADFSEAAKSISWFYSHEGGIDVDTVISVNSEFFKDLLDIIGEINMVKYSTIVNSENFNEVVQKQVEDDYYDSKENTSVSEPKSILSEMMPVVMVRAKKLGNIFKIYDLLIKSLVNKNIQIFCFNPNQERKVLSKNWGGSILSSDSDYLYINHANLGANKSSIYIEESIAYDIAQTTDDLIASLDLKRSYNNSKHDKENINFSRVYVPLGSSLVSASKDDKDITTDIAVDEEFGKTVFRFWTNVAPNESHDFKLVYKLPNYVKLDKYKLILQKQSGAINQNFSLYKNNNFISTQSFTSDLVFDK